MNHGYIQCGIKIRIPNRSLKQIIQGKYLNFEILSTSRKSCKTMIFICRYIIENYNSIDDHFAHMISAIMILIAKHSSNNFRR